MFESTEHKGGHYLSLDPGYATGYATFTKEGALVDWGTLRTPEAFMDFLAELKPKPKVIICEEFKLFQKRALQQSGSDMVASRMIGVMQLYAAQNKCEVVYQPASIKKIAEMWSGKAPPSTHKYSHGIDAFNHGIYYLIRNKIRKPVKRGEEVE